MSSAACRAIPAAWTAIAVRTPSDNAWTPLPGAPLTMAQAEIDVVNKRIETREVRLRRNSVFQIRAIPVSGAR